MSGNLASFAKSAFKEAQKTIDKALDIKDESPSGSIIAGAGSDFFSSWGVAVSSKYGGDTPVDDKLLEDKDTSGSVSASASLDVPKNDWSSHNGLSKESEVLTSRKESISNLPLVTESLQVKDNEDLDDVPLRKASISVEEIQIPSNKDPSQCVKQIDSSAAELRGHPAEDQFQSLWLSEDTNSDIKFNSELSEVHNEDQEKELGEYPSHIRIQQTQTVVKPTPVSSQGECPIYCPPQDANTLFPNVTSSEETFSDINLSSEDVPKQHPSPDFIEECLDDENEQLTGSQYPVASDSTDSTEFIKKPEMLVSSKSTVECLPEESELTVSFASQGGEWGWPSSDFADSVISADASTLTNSSTSEHNSLAINNLSSSDVDNKRNVGDDNCKLDNSQELCDILPENREKLESEEEIPKDYPTSEGDDPGIELSSNAAKSQSHSPQESVETSENEHEEADASPKISSRATSSISVLSGASEKESPCPSSPALGGYGASSNSDSPSFEIISMHSSTKRNGNQNHKPCPQEFFLSSSITGENSQVESNLGSSCSSSIANVYSCNSNSAIENSSSSFERIEPVSNASSHGSKVHQHKKAPSSASSSDIEVIPLDSTDRKFCGSTPQVSDRLYAVAETQTDFHEGKPEKVLVPPKMAVQVAEIISEKDSEIKQLREEGEKLSKKQFELSNVIKKLRAKEKENETATKNLRQELATKNAEYEKLMKTYVVREGVEKTQNENICKLTSERRQLELMVEQLQSELEDSKANCMSMKNSLENSAVEILELKVIISSAHRDVAELDSLTREKSELVNRTESLVKEVDHLRDMVKTTQMKAAERESEMKTNISQLTHKVHVLEDQLADASSEVADATMPLSLEIDKLQQELTAQRYVTEKRESSLQSKILELESKLQGAAEREASFKGMQDSITKSSLSMENQIDTLKGENKHLKSGLEKANDSLLNLEKKVSHMNQLEKRIASVTAEVEQLRNENESLSNELKRERSMSESERKKSQSLQDQLNRNQGYHVRNKSMDSTSTVSNQNIKSGENSPSSQSIVSEVSYLDEVFDTSGHNNRSLTPKSFFDNFSSANFIETLQSQLRLRESEAIQFQEQVAKNEKIRKTLNDEIANLTVKNQELLIRLESMNSLQDRMEEVEKNYNAVLQMYGEKVEESEELRLDLQDVKEMYKLQIEQLLRK